jgi:chromosome partitioning protein
MAARVTTFAAQKGGVGKSTLIIQSCFMAKVIAGARVLLIDVDPQCNSAGVFVDEEQLAADNFTVSSQLYGECGDISPIKGRYGVDVIPGDDGINAFPKDLTNGAFLELLSRIDIKKEDEANRIIQEVADNQLIAFAENVKRLRDTYDYIFIDVPPSFLGLPLISSLCAASDVVGLLEPTKFSSDVVGDFIDKVTSIRETYNPSMTFHGFIVNKFRGTSSRHKDRVDQWSSQLGHLLLSDPIKVASWIEDRTEDGEPVFTEINSRHRKAGSEMMTNAIRTVFPEFVEK